MLYTWNLILYVTYISIKKLPYLKIRVHQQATFFSLGYWKFDFLILDLHFFCSRASLGTQLVENLPAMQETWVWWLGWENPLEKGTATHSSILAWRIPQTV